MSDNIKWGDLREPGLLPLYDALDMLRLGINERRQGAQWGVLGALTRLDHHYYGIYQDLHDSVTALIPKYVNHLAPSEDWETKPNAVRQAEDAGREYNEAYPLYHVPMWTEDDILAAAGYDERFSPPTRLNTSAEWVKQTFEIVNLLRWVAWSTHWNFPTWRYIPRQDGMTVGFYVGYGNPDNIPMSNFFGDAAHEWDKQRWFQLQSVPDFARSFCEIYQSEYKTYWFFYMERVAKTFGVHYTWPRPLTFACKAFLQRWEQPPFASSGDFDPTEIGFSAADENTVINVFDAEILLDGAKELALIGKHDSPPFYPWTDPGLDAKVSVSWEVRIISETFLEPDIILKMDQPNGFEFLDI